MEESRENKLLKNTIILAIGTFFPKLAVFITLPILTGYLTQTEYGTYDLVLTLVSLLLPAATLQIQTAAFRFLIEKRDNKEAVESIVTNIYAFIFPVSIIVLVALYFVLSSQNSLLRILICAYFMLDILSGTSRQVVRGLGRNSAYTISAFISAVCQIVCVALFVWAVRWGLTGAVLGLCIGEFGSFVYLAFVARFWKLINVKLLSSSQLKALLKYSWPMVPNSLSMWVMRVSDRLVITAVMGVEANAVYAVAYKMPSILNLAHSTFNMAWQESASIAVNDSDANQYFSGVFSNLYNLTVGMLSALIGITPILFTILVRGDYGDAYNQIIVLYLAIFFCTISSFWGGLYVAFQKTKSIGLTATTAAVINLVVDIALIKRIGLYAASGSTLVSYLFLCIYRIVDTRKFVQIKYKFTHIFLTLAVIIAQCFVCAERNVVLDAFNLVIGLFIFAILNKHYIIIFFDKFMKIIKKKK